MKQYIIVHKKKELYSVSTKDILKATTTDYLIVRASQTGGYSYKTSIL